MELYIHTMKLENFRNIEKGELSFADSKMDKLHVVGIYGQNGSGKTTFVESVHFIRRILSGNIFMEENYIHANAQEASIEVEFVHHTTDGEKLLLKYAVTLNKVAKEKAENGTYSDPQIVITKEKVSYRIFGAESKRYTTLLEFNRDAKAFFKIYGKSMLTNEENRIKFAVIKEMTTAPRASSFLFNPKLVEEVVTLLGGTEPENIELLELYYLLHTRFIEESIIILNSHTSRVYDNLSLPVPFSFERDEKGYRGKIELSFAENVFITDFNYEIARHLFRQMNEVLPSIIEGLQIDLKVVNDQVIENNVHGKNISIYSAKNGRELPFSYESDGTKKIVSILSALIHVYGSESAIVVIDELDAGLFEFLLGEIIEILGTSTKGQLIFTSHNLRVLEVLPYKNIIFSTSDPQKRFVKIRNVRETNNLRDVYLRAIQLGGQEAELYSGEVAPKIKRAFRKAGKVPFESEEVNE